MGINRIHIIITGHVQMVGYRVYVQSCAKNLDVFGWVQNVGNCKVETIGEGGLESLNNFLLLVTKGPRGSRVSDVNINWGSSTGEFHQFDIL
jgi:acylphosphatase